MGFRSTVSRHLGTALRVRLVHGIGRRVAEWLPMALSQRAGKRLAVGMVIAGVLLFVSLAVGFPLVRTAQEDPVAACAKKFESRKTGLVSAEWTWVPPGWACHFREGPSERVP